MLGIMLIVTDIHRNVIVVDGIMHQPVPSRVAVAKVGFAHELSIGNIHKAIRDRHADFHAFHFIVPLVLIRPPYACANAFAGGVDPRMTRLVTSKGKTTEPPLVDWRPGVVELDRVDAASMQYLRKINKDRAGVALVLQRDSTEENFVNSQHVRQIELDSRIVLKHFEPDSVLPADELFLWINADIEVVKKQVVVGAIRPVGSTQDVSMRRFAVATRPLWRSCLPGS